MKTLLDFHFTQLSYISFFPLWLAVIACLLYRTRHKLHAYALLTGKHYSSLLIGFSPFRVIGQACLYTLGTFFLFLAALGPALHTKKEIIHQKGRDVFIILDISRSMLAQDCNPNRLETAKQKIKKLLKLLSCERIALVLFSGSALIQCPLTTDYAAFLMFLDTVTAETISSGTTSLDRALKKVLESIAATTHDFSSKKTLMIVFTDGEDFSANLSPLKDECKEKNAHLFAIGIGSPEGAPVPLYDHNGILTGHQKDHNGAIVISRINQEFLRMTTQELGGDYSLYTDNNSDIQKIFASIQSFEKKDFGDSLVQSDELHYHSFLAVSLICFLLDWLL